MARELEIIEELRERVTFTPYQEGLLDELEKLIKKDVLWPLKAREAAEEVFGGSIHNPNSRVHGSLDRRIRHLLKVWRNRYGLNDRQAIHAGDWIAWAIRDGKKRAGDRADLLHPYVFSGLDKLANDERVHAGMERRAGYVDVTAQLAELS